MTETSARYRHRAPEVEAVQWTGANAEQLRVFCSPFDFQLIDPEDRIEDPEQTAAVRESEHGTWRGLKPGDWVLKRGVNLHEVSAADFAKRYEAAVPSAPAGVAEAIRTFPFDNFGMDDVSFALEDDPEAQEWVPALAAAVLATLPATTARAVEVRDYWHQEAMSATTRIIELEGQLKELRRMADETPQPETEARRGDVFEQWLKAQRDEYHQTRSPQWLALDEALDTYRLHADTGTPLGGHVCEGRAVCGSECLERPATEEPTP